VHESAPRFRTIVRESVHIWARFGQLVKSKQLPLWHRHPVDDLR
jgi:hypothetical protein